MAKNKQKNSKATKVAAKAVEKVKAGKAKLVQEAPASAELGKKVKSPKPGKSKKAETATSVAATTPSEATSPTSPPTEVYRSEHALDGEDTQYSQVLDQYREDDLKALPDAKEKVLRVQRSTRLRALKKGEELPPLTGAPKVGGYMEFSDADNSAGVVETVSAEELPPPKKLSKKELKKAAKAAQKRPGQTPQEEATEIVGALTAETDVGGALVKDEDGPILKNKKGERVGVPAPEVKAQLAKVTAKPPAPADPTPAAPRTRAPRAPRFSRESQVEQAKADKKGKKVSWVVPVPYKVKNAGQRITENLASVLGYVPSWSEETVDVNGEKLFQVTLTFSPQK